MNKILKNLFGSDIKSYIDAIVLHIVSREDHNMKSIEIIKNI